MNSFISIIKYISNYQVGVSDWLWELLSRHRLSSQKQAKPRKFPSVYFAILWILGLLLTNSQSYRLTFTAKSDHSGQLSLSCEGTWHRMSGSPMGKAASFWKWFIFQEENFQHPMLQRQMLLLKFCYNTFGCTPILISCFFSNDSAFTVKRRWHLTHLIFLPF